MMKMSTILLEIPLMGGYLMECSQSILANGETVNKLHLRRYVQKSEIRFHHDIFPLKHEGSNNAGC